VFIVVVVVVSSSSSSCSFFCSSSRCDIVVTCVINILCRWPSCWSTYTSHQLRVVSSRRLSPANSEWWPTVHHCRCYL